MATLLSSFRSRLRLRRTAVRLLSVCHRTLVPSLLSALFPSLLALVACRYDTSLAVCVCPILFFTAASGTLRRLARCFPFPRVLRASGSNVLNCSDCDHAVPLISPPNDDGRVLQAAAAAAPAAAAAAGEEPMCEWSYSGANGPEAWGSICSKKYPLCAAGRKQSPVNIKTLRTAKGPVSTAPSLLFLSLSPSRDCRSQRCACGSVAVQFRFER